MCRSQMYVRWSVRACCMRMCSGYFGANFFLLPIEYEKLKLPVSNAH